MFEEASVVGTITYTAKHNRAVIIKVVPKELTGKEAQSSLNEQSNNSTDPKKFDL